MRHPFAPAEAHIAGRPFAQAPGSSWPPVVRGVLEAAGNPAETARGTGAHDRCGLHEQDRLLPRAAAFRAFGGRGASAYARRSSRATAAVRVERGLFHG